MAEPYRKDMDFAFFAVNFGYSKSDYEALTNREKAFIYKAWESKIVSDTTFMYNSVFTAVYNANRPKRKRALKLWNKPKVRKADMETIHSNMEMIREIEEKEHNWIQAVYRANNLPVPKKRGEKRERTNDTIRKSHR